MDTKTEEYTARLVRLHGEKRFFDGQFLYRWHLRALQLGDVLEIGCGIGRNLENLPGGTAVGIDHNEHSVLIAKERGYTAFLPEDFRVSEFASPGRFDALLFSHVAEHMSFDSAVNLMREYLPFLKLDGRVVIITPQELGFASDPTHVHFVDFDVAAEILAAVGVTALKQYSFPLPRFFGKFFRYNEYMTIGHKARPGGS